MLRYTYHKIFVLLICYFAYSSAFAQGYPQVFAFDKSDYGASSKNWSIASDSKGIVYIGNHEGLLEYNGQNWKLYHLPTGGIVRSVYVDKNDRIYTGSYEEFGYWEADNTGLLHYTLLSNQLKDFTFHNEEIWKIVEKDNSIYFQSFSRIFKYENGVIEAQKDSDTNYFIYFLLKAGKQLIAQTLKEGIVELNADMSFSVINNRKEFIDTEIKTALPLNNQEYILGSGTKGLYRWDGDQINIWDTEAHQQLKDKQINTGLSDGKYFYVGTILDGLYIIDKKGNVIHHLNTENYLSDNTVLGMHLDKDRNLWLALNKGICLISFNTPYHPIIKKKNKIGSVYTAVLYNNNLYLGTNQGVYYHPFHAEDISNLKLENFRYIEGIPGQTWILKIVDEQLLCGHTNGTYRIEPNNQITKLCNITGGQNFEKYNYNNHNYLIQSTFTSLVLYNKDISGKWQFFKRIEKFNEPSKFCEADHLGNIWIKHKSRNGIYRVRLDTGFDAVSEVKYYNNSDSLPENVNANIFMLDNRIVFPTEKGMFTYDELNKKIIIYQEMNRQVGEFAKARKITDVENNRYWFLLKDKAGLFEITNGIAEKIVQFNFNRPELSLVEAYENIVPLNEKLHLICLENGFAIYNLSNDIIVDSLVVIKFREITATENNIRLPLIQSEDSQGFNYRNNYISFSYSSFKYPGADYRFSYKLEGLNVDWSHFSANSSVSFSRLPWGDYTFRVKGKDEFGREIPEATYSFVVFPPWYASKIAYAFYVLLLLSVPIGIRFYLKKQNS